MSDTEQPANEPQPETGDDGVPQTLVGISFPDIFRAQEFLTAATGLALAGTSLSSDTAAETAMTAIDTALGTLADAFAEIGAKQNRIDYAAANVKTAIENVSAAESTIRDADMAAEMTEFTRNQILQQAGVAMLAQANAAPQLVLRLLQ